MAHKEMDFDAFFDSYLETALWSTNDESDPETGGEPMNANYGTDDIDEKSYYGLRKEALRFYKDNVEDIVSWEGRGYGPHVSAGHDFWLTRNGHGAGFWDGDWPEPMATRLTEESERYGEVDLYVGDDGKIYASGYEGGAGGHPGSEASRTQRGSFEAAGPRRYTKLPGPREGTRVRFSPNPASYALYSDPPPVGDEGRVTTVLVPGGRRTYMRGPGGGLVYVNWNRKGVQGVALQDLEKV